MQMKPSLTQKRDSRSRPMGLAFVAACVLAMVWTQGNIYAGCYHPRGDEPQVTLDPVGNPLPLNIRKVYEGGLFRYYALPTGTTCNGPTCKSAPVSTVAAVPSATAPDRLTFSITASQAGFEIELPLQRACLRDSTQIDDPFLSGLLRPPTI